MNFRQIALAVALLPLPAFAQAIPEEARPLPAQANAPLTIDQAVAFALEQDPVLVTQQLQARSSVEDVNLSKSNIYPSLTFNASYGRTRVGGGESLQPITITYVVPGVCDTPPCIIPQKAPVQIFPNYVAGLTASQLLYDGGKWWNNIAAAEKALVTQREQAEEQKLLTAFTARQKFYELVRAQRSLEVLKEAARRSREQADWTQRLYEGGRSTQADVYAARANRDNDEVNRLSQEAQVEQARQDLAIAIGRDPAQPLAVVDPPNLSQDPTTPPAVLPAVEQALGKRPSLRALRATIEQSAKLVEVAEGDYLPVVSLNAQYLRATRSFSDFTLSPEQANQLSASVSLRWNIFSGFATRANVSKARVAVQLAEVQYQAGRRSVASDVERAVAVWTSARTRALVAKQLEENASKGLQLAKARQEVGVGTQLEVRDAELKVTQSQLSRVSALVDGHEAQAAFLRATGDI